MVNFSSKDIGNFHDINDRKFQRNYELYCKTIITFFIEKIKKICVCELEQKKMVRPEIYFNEEGLVFSWDIKDYTTEKLAFIDSFVFSLFLEKLECAYYNPRKADEKYILILADKSLARLFYFIYGWSQTNWKEALSEFYIMNERGDLDLHPQLAINKNILTESFFLSSIDETVINNAFKDASPKIIKSNIDYALVLITDTTGSMGEQLKEAKTLFSRLVTLLPGNVSSTFSDRNIMYKFAAVSYQDYGDHNLTETEWNKNTKACSLSDFSSEAKEAENFIKELELGGGDDAPEAIELALYRSRFLSWPENKENMLIIKNIFIVFDAPPHAAAYPGRDNYPTPRENPAKLYYEDELNKLKSMGIKIYPILCNSPCSTTIKFAQSVATTTGGIVINLSEDFSQLLTKIIDNMRADVQETTYYEEAAKILRDRGEAITHQSLLDVLAKKSDFTIHQSRYHATSSSEAVSSLDSSASVNNFIINNNTSTACFTKKSHKTSTGASKRYNEDVVILSKGETDCKPKLPEAPTEKLFSRHEERSRISTLNATITTSTALPKNPISNLNATNQVSSTAAPVTRLSNAATLFANEDSSIRANQPLASLSSLTPPASATLLQRTLPPFSSLAAPANSNAAAATNKMSNFYQPPAPPPMKPLEGSSGRQKISSFNQNKTV